MQSIVDIGQNGFMLSSADKHLVVSRDGATVQRIHFSKIEALVIHAQQITYSQHLLVSLSEANIPIIFCDATHLPTAMLVSTQGHHQQSHRIRLQIAASVPKKKNIWRDIIRLKLQQQGLVLQHYKSPVASSLFAFSASVKSGDSTNLEGAGASQYFRGLFGSDFYRRTDGSGLNKFLNYGYTILRSHVARAVVASGLNPSLAVYHSNKNNAFCLVDDLIEPFRPVVDMMVKSHEKTWHHLDMLPPDGKSALVSLLHQPVMVEGVETSLQQAITYFVQSYVRLLEGHGECLVFPTALFQS